MFKVGQVVTFLGYRNADGTEDTYSNSVMLLKKGATGVVVAVTNSIHYPIIVRMHGHTYRDGDDHHAFRKTEISPVVEEINIERFM